MYIRFTEKLNTGAARHRLLVVMEYDKNHYNEYGVIGDAKNQNDLRRMIAIILKHGSCFGRTLSMSGFDLRVMKTEDNGYRLLTYIRNWESRASFYAGVILGVSRIKRRRRKKRKCAN